MTKNSPYDPKKAMDKRVKDALAQIEKAADERTFLQTHTADGVEIKKGLKVFYIHEITTEHVIEDIHPKKLRRNVTLKDKSISVHSMNLYCDVNKAIDAKIEYINNARSIILREMREGLARLNYDEEIDNLTKLKKYVDS